ncbi:MAG TPA: GyrI-like domain-containing protein [Telluria sp.]|nr:GyrI-like domain-containing protein [Telluria sp.]
MIDIPQLVHTSAQRTAVIHLTVPASEIRKVMGPAVNELMAVLAAQGIEPFGPRFSHHLKMPGAVFDLEIGVPVATAVAPAGTVTGGELPAAAVARTVYHGGMEGLGAAWGELGAWVAANGRQTRSYLWEYYVVGPDNNPDPAAWKTELNWPLAN